jgi:uncharacterized protein (DUF302 family)/ketosteroid isomerase-like protein
MASNNPPAGITTKISPRSVRDTVERLLGLIQAREMKVFAVIDQAAEARDVKLRLRPTTLVIFGSPVAGSPVMDAAPLAAMDLPLKILVWDDNGQTKVSYIGPAEIADRYGLDADLTYNLSGIDPLTDALVALEETTTDRNTHMGSNRETVKEAFDDWMNGTGNVSAIFAPNMTWEIVGHSAASTRYSSAQEFQDKVLTPFAQRFDQNRPFRPVNIRGLYVDGDTVIVIWDGSGTTITGATYENTYAWIMTLHDGKIIDSTAFYDSISFNSLWEIEPRTD